MDPTKKDYLHVLLDLSVVFLTPWGNGSRIIQAVFLWCVQAQGAHRPWDGDQLAVGAGMERVNTIEKTPSAAMWFTA